MILSVYEKMLIEKNNDVINNINLGTKFLKGKWIVSLTTTPKRIENLQNCINRIYKWKIIPPLIIINIAKKYKRWPNEELNIPKIMNIFEPRVKIIVHEEDEGPGLKLIGTIKYLKKNPEQFTPTAIITIDDDIIYPNNFMIDMFIKHTKNPDYIICRKGFIWSDYLKMGGTPLNLEIPVDIAEGFGSILYPYKYFETNDFLNYWNYILKIDDVHIFDDDLIFSVYWSMKKIKRYRIPLERKNTYLGILEMGNKKDALHLQKWGNISNERKRKLWIYNKILNYIKDYKNDLYLNKNMNKEIKK